MDLSSATVAFGLSRLFWFFATFDVVISIGIEVWVRTARTCSLKANR